MMGVIHRFLVHVVLVFSQIALQVSALARENRQGQVSLRGLWDEHASQASSEIDASGLAEGHGGAASTRQHLERVTLAAGGALLRSEKQEPEVNLPHKTGSIARRLIERDGLRPAGTPFAGAAVLKGRLEELRSRCPGALAPGWVLLDASQDDTAGHHWVLRGPGPDESLVLLHVSSVGGHAPLILSPRKLCQQLPSSLLEDISAAEPDVLVDEPEQAQLSNPNVRESIKHIQDLVKAETADKCKDDSMKVANATALSAKIEVAAGINVLVTTRLSSQKDGVTPTFHVFSVDWHVCNTCANGLSPTLVLPFDQANQEEMGWCDLLFKSTESHLGSLAESQGPDAPGKWIGKLGLLSAYRDYHPDEMLEKDQGTRKAADCIAVSALPDTWGPWTNNPDCISSQLVEDQGECASCWAFAIMQSLAVRACLKYRTQMMGAGDKRRQFSKQQLLSCNTKQYGCSGGVLSAGFEETRKGIALDGDYPYYPGHAREFPWSGTGSRCKWGLLTKPWVVTAHYSLQGYTSAKLQQELYCKGPIVVGFLIKSNFFNFWKTETDKVYAEADATAPGVTDVGGHAVTMLGWGIKEPTAAGGASINFWQLVNSWGDLWGSKGFFRMQRGVNLCGIENMAVRAGDIVPTTGSWMYGDWSSCDVAKDRKSRPIQCKSNDGVTGQERETCPNSDMTYWPNVFEFPDPTSRHYQEIEAFKSCTDTPAECTMFGACSGNGNAKMVGGTCQCTCFAFYEGERCNQCNSAASGYPRCREKCADSDCGEHGTSTGNKWHTEFGDPRDNCQCSCHDGFAGDTCNACANPETHTFPACHGSAGAFNHTAATSTARPTTTEPPPCHVNRGPIELMPPSGDHWITLDCDVRRRDCEPDHDKCVNATVFQQYCEWKNTSAFPAGQCLSKNASLYHARIEGTKRGGENGITENRSVHEGPQVVHR